MARAPKDDASRYRANLKGEIDGVSLYRGLAAAERDPRLADVYRRLALMEETHAEFWRTQLERLGAPIPQLRPAWRTRALTWLARRFGPGLILPTVNALEQADSAQYDAQPEAVARGLPPAERSHARLVQAMAGAEPSGLEGSAIARLEGRHRALGGNALRAAVLGANDGLVSNLSLVMGMAGAGANSRTLLLGGLAGLVAGAGSMAMGEWISVQSSRELNQRQITTEAAELAASPDEEREELALIYEAKGLPAEQARTLADRLFSRKDVALDTLVREELGIDPEKLGGSAWVAAGWSFLLFASGAILPIAPFFVLAGRAALAASIVLAALALMAIGAGTSLFTGRGVALLAVRQLGIGLAAAALTYGVGILVGVTLAG